MKVAELLAERHKNWAELQMLCYSMGGRSGKKISSETVIRFAALYRAACADLALADAYQLPSNTIAFLHQLVAQAHNLLYRSRSFMFREWLRELLFRVPQRIFADKFVWISAVLFFGMFAVSFLMARYSPDYAKEKIGEENMIAMRYMHSHEHIDDPFQVAVGGTFGGAYYIQHNTGIGLKCFAFGLLMGVGGMFEIFFNAVFLGAVFGFMSLQPEAPNFFNFVTAHGPFELTAIVLSAAAGMRMGFAISDTKGMTRSASLRRAGREAMPVMGAAMLLFFGAALIEGFVSPSAAPYWMKASLGALCLGLLFFYFVILGMPREWLHPAPKPASDEGTWESAVREA